jgi:type IV pilus assembly protein PilA
MNKRNPSKHGFTLIELMIVVAILGILAAVAIPAFVQYMRRAKTSEATLMIERMWMGAVKYFQEEHMIRGVVTTWIVHALPKSAGPTPPIADIKDEKLQASAYLLAFTSNRSWEALDFGMTDNFYYSYEFVTCTMDSYNECEAGSTLYCRAQGDLDADKTYSLFERQGRINNVPNIGWTIEGSAGIYKMNPVE